MATILLAIAVFAMFAWAGYAVYKQHKSGKCSGCDAPGGCACCHLRDGEKERNA